MHNRYIELLETSKSDTIDGYLLNDNTWTITGFDNFSYYTLENNILTFSINIADIDKRSMDVFSFTGKIVNEGKQIKSVISSTDKVFNNNILELNYKSLK